MTGVPGHMMLVNVELALDEVEIKLIFKLCHCALSIVLSIPATMYLYLPLLRGRLIVAALEFLATAPTTHSLPVGNCNLLHPSLHLLHLSADPLCIKTVADIT